MAVPNILLRQFQTAGISDWVPGKLAETYAQLETLAFGVFEKERGQWRVHFHFEDGECEGKALPFLWNSGGYFDASCLRAGKLHVFAHFEKQRAPSENRRRTIGHAVPNEASSHQRAPSSPLTMVDEVGLPVGAPERPMLQDKENLTFGTRKRSRVEDLSSDSDESEFNPTGNLHALGSEDDDDDDDDDDGASDEESVAPLDRCFVTTPPQSLPAQATLRQHAIDYARYTSHNAAPNEYGYKHNWNVVGDQWHSKTAHARLIHGIYGVPSPIRCQRCVQNELDCRIYHPSIKPLGACGSCRLSCKACVMGGQKHRQQNNSTKRQRVSDSAVNLPLACPVVGCTSRSAAGFSRRGNLETHIRDWHPNYTQGREQGRQEDEDDAGFEDDDFQNDNLQDRVAMIFNPEMAIDSCNCPVPGCNRMPSGNRSYLKVHISTNHPELASWVGSDQLNIDATTRHDMQRRFDWCVKQQPPSCPFRDCPGKSASGFSTPGSLIYHIRSLHPEHTYLLSKYCTNGALVEADQASQHTSNTLQSTREVLYSDASALHRAFNQSMREPHPPCPISNCTGRGAHGYSRPDALVYHIRKLHPEHVNLLEEFEKPREGHDQAIHVATPSQSNVRPRLTPSNTVPNGHPLTCPVPDCRTTAVNGFSRKDHLTRHMRLYHSDWEQAQTSDSATFQVVAETRNGRMEYRCPVNNCNHTRSYFPFSNLKQHVEHRHPGASLVEPDKARLVQPAPTADNEYVCPVVGCEYTGTFRKRLDLRQHIHSEHPKYGVHPNPYRNSVNMIASQVSTSSIAHKAVKNSPGETGATFACPVEGCSVSGTPFEQFRTHVWLEHPSISHGEVLRAVYESKSFSSLQSPSMAEYDNNFATFVTTNAAEGEFGHRAEHVWNKIIYQSRKRIAIARLINGKYGVPALQPCSQCKARGLTCLGLHPALQGKGSVGSIYCGECLNRGGGCTNPPGPRLMKNLSQGTYLQPFIGSMSHGEGDSAADLEQADESDVAVEQLTTINGSAEARFRTHSKESADSEDIYLGEGSDGDEDDTASGIHVIDLGSSPSTDRSTNYDLDRTDSSRSAAQSPNYSDYPEFYDDEGNRGESHRQWTLLRDIESQSSAPVANVPNSDRLQDDNRQTTGPALVRSPAIHASTASKADSTSSTVQKPSQHHKEDSFALESVARVRSNATLHRTTPNRFASPNLRSSPYLERSRIAEILLGTPDRGQTTRKSDRMSPYGQHRSNLGTFNDLRATINSSWGQHSVDDANAEAGAEVAPDSTIIQSNVVGKYDAIPQDAILQHEVSRQHELESVDMVHDELYN